MPDITGTQCEGLCISTGENNFVDCGGCAVPTSFARSSCGSACSLTMARFRAYDSDSDSDDSSSLSSSSDSETPEPKLPATRRRSFGAYNHDDDDLSSSDSDASRMDEDELVATPKKHAPKANGVKKHPPPTVESVSSSRSSSRTPPPPPPQPSQPPPPKSRPDPTVIPRAQQLGVDSGRVHVMQASLFRMPEEEAALKAASQTKRPLHLQLNRKHSRGSDGGGLRTESVEVRACAVASAGWKC